MILVIYSFNASRLVTVWGGWSTRWYVELWHDQAMLDAAWVSLRVAALSASAATILGTLAALALVRIGRFRGRVAFSAMVYAPLVMPEVIIGLSLLLLFVTMDFDRGLWTTTLAHTTLTMCFVTVIVQSRLIGFDWSLEEAAMDLGAPPLKAFLSVTLPLIISAIAAGWMLAFTFRSTTLRSGASLPARARPRCPSASIPRSPARREAGDQRHFHGDDCGCGGSRRPRIDPVQTLGPIATRAQRGGGAG